MSFQPRKNRYLLMRHGESTANVTRTISSHPAYSRFGAGLSDRGRQQVAARGEVLRAEIQRESTVIYSSDFRRAHESAALIAQLLELPHPALDPNIAPLLRERGFGALEGLSTSFYPIVWAMDGAGATLPGCESVSAVCQRMTRALEVLEDRYDQQTILLVSHGDPIQILLADSILGSPLKHRELSAIETAEIRAFPSTLR